MLNVTPNSPRPTRQPVFNLPRSVAGLLVAILAVQALRAFLLDDNANLWVVLHFAFIPLRVTAAEAVAAVLPVGGERIWTFLTHAFLHVDWAHALLNALWLAAFGSPLAWRFGTARFLAFSAVAAAAGALMHLAIYPHSPVPLVGASAAISAHMAGSARFVFHAGGPRFGLAGPAAYRHPAVPLGEALGNRRVLALLGVWFGLNLVFGLVSSVQGMSGIAWEAHIGGFLAGLFLFPVFDPVSKTRR